MLQMLSQQRPQKLLDQHFSTCGSQLKSGLFWLGTASWAVPPHPLFFLFPFFFVCLFLLFFLEKWIFKYINLQRKMLGVYFAKHTIQFRHFSDWLTCCDWKWKWVFSVFREPADNHWFKMCLCKFSHWMFVCCRWRAARRWWRPSGSCWGRRGGGAWPRGCRLASCPRCPPLCWWCWATRPWRGWACGPSSSTAGTGESRITSGTLGRFPCCLPLGGGGVVVCHSVL